MALFKISKGTAANLVANRPYAAEGHAYFTTDDGKFYIDIAGDGSTTAAVVGTNRIPLNAAIADKVAHLLTIQLNSGTTAGRDLFTYDGSGAVLVNITPESIGAAPLSAIGASDRWTQARDFIITDSDGHSGPATAVDGSANVSLVLPSTITADILGNASTADALNHRLQIQLNTGIDAQHLKTFNGSADVDINITPALIDAVNKTGDTMTGSLILPTASSMVNDTGSLLWKQAGYDTIKAGLGTNNGGTLAITATDGIRLLPDRTDTTKYIQFTKNQDISAGATNTWSLGRADRRWLAVYATTFDGNATSADKVNNTLQIQLNGGATEGNNLFTYDGSAHKLINITPAAIGALGINDAAAAASKWLTPRTFSISDADGTNTGTGVSVDGSANVTLLLPSTIKADLTGTASLASSLVHRLQLQFNSGIDAQHLKTFNGSADVDINITPSLVGAVATTGDTMTGSLVLAADNNDDSPSIIFLRGADADTNDDIRLYDTAGKLVVAHRSGSADWVDLFSFDVAANISTQHLLPSSDDTLTLGASDHKWATVYATTFSGNATSADKVNNTIQIQLNGGSNEGSNLFTYDGSVHKLINITPASIGAVSTTGAAASADKWTTARAFTISDAEGANTGAAVNVDGSAAVTLKLPATIKANLTGNAATATKVNNTLQIQLNGGANEGQNLFTYDGSVQKLVNITPAGISALALAGGTMTGDIVLWNGTSYNEITPSLVFRRGTLNDAYYDARINNDGGYIQFQTNTGTNAWSNMFRIHPDDIISYVRIVPSAGNALDLGSSTTKWKTVYATSFNGLATEASKVTNNLAIQFDGGSTEGSNLFTFNGSAPKTVNITPESIKALRETANAVSASKWATARKFYISDATNAHTGVGVDVDGSGDVILKLPSVMTIGIAGNASTADKVNHRLQIQLNSGTDAQHLKTFDGSADIDVNITPALIGALALTGGTMTGQLLIDNVSGPKINSNNIDLKVWEVVGNAGSWNSQYGFYEFYKGSGSGNDNTLELYADNQAGSHVKVRTVKQDGTVTFHTGVTFSQTITGSVTGNAATANKVNHDLAIQFNGGSTEGTNLFTYNGSAAKTVNITPAKVGAVAKSGDTMTGLLTLSGNPTAAMHAATKQYVDNAFGVNDAMVYKGVISGNATAPGTFTPAANAGWTYRVDKAGYINGEPVEVGDLIICNTDNTAAATSSTYATVNLNWNIVQVNVDKAVYYGLNALSNGAVLLADGTSGKAKTAGTVGSATRPIYLNGGVPTALSYTANRLYYSASASSFEATGHYASASKIAINSTSAPSGALHINGATTASDNITVTKGNTAAPQIKVSNGTYEASIYVGSGGTNHGLVSNINNPNNVSGSWIIYRNSANVYVPEWASIGSTNQPIYIDSSGRPATTQFTLGAKINGGTANRIAWYKGNNEVAAASTHYISDTQMHIGATSAPASGYSLAVTGQAQFNNIVHLLASQYYSENSKYAIHAHNSDIIGLNGLWWEDVADSANEGIHFPHGSNWDSLYAANGLLRFAPNHAKNAGTAGNVVPTTGNTTGNVGSATQPVYVDTGVIKSCSYYLQASVLTGTKWGVAYYSNDNPQSITSTAQGAANTALMGKGAAAPAFVSVSPTLTPTSGTTAGQKIKLTVLGVAGSEITLDSASNTHSGVITTGNQEIAGIKTFKNATESSSKSTGAVQISGGLGVNMTMSSLKVRVGDKVRLEYNSTTLSLDFIFE